AIAVLPLAHPAAEDRLRFAARVAGDPGRVRVRRVDEVAAGFRVGVEHGERGLLVGAPSEDVPAEAEGEDLQIALSESPRGLLRHACLLATFPSACGSAHAFLTTVLSETLSTSRGPTADRVRPESAGARGG